MKTILMLVILGLITGLVGCVTEIEKVENINSNIIVDSESESEKVQGYCILTATEEDDGRYLMLDELFSQKIECETNNDCYDLLLQDDDYRSLLPEFEPYLNCEKVIEIIEPNQK